MEENEYTIIVDMFSIGVITYQMLMGRFPFVRENNDILLLHKIKNDKIIFDNLVS